MIDKKYQWTLLIIPLIIGAIILSSSEKINAVDRATQPQIERTILQTSIEQAQQKYPTATKQEILTIANKQAKEILNKPEAKQQIQEIKNTVKETYRENGQTHLYDPDTYFYLRYAQNILKKGHQGETLKEGKPYDTLRYAPVGKEVQPSLLPIIEAYWHKIWKTFDTNATLLKTTFYLPVILGLISITLIYLLTLTIFKNHITAFFSATLLAVHPFFFKQNMAGFTDTTTLILPLTLAYFIGINLALQQHKKTGIITAIIALALLKYTWNGWFYLLAITAAIIPIIAITKGKKTHKTALIILTIIIIISLYQFGYVDKAIQKLQIAERITGIQTTVAELKAPTIIELKNALGGTLFTLLLITAITLLIIRAIKRQITIHEIILLIWLAALLIPTLKAIRFAFFIMPPAVIITSQLLEKIHKKLTEFTTGIIPNKIATILILAIIPLTVGATMIDTNTPFPRVNTGMLETANWIKQNTESNAIINTWWDNGYIWQYLTQRPTTQDAAPGKGTYWLSEALISTNTTYSKNVLRMLNCGNTLAYAEIEKSLKGTTILKKTLSQNKQQAEQTLKENNLTHLINLTLCTPKEAYIIIDAYELINAIEAIANWEPELGVITQTQIEKQEMIEIIQKDLNYTKEQAENTYYKAFEPITVEAGETTKTATCLKTNTTIQCPADTIDLEKIEPIKGNPSSITIITNQTRQEKTFEKGKYALIIYQENKDYKSITLKPEQKDTLIVKLYTENEIEGFEKVHSTHIPSRITTWKINWNDTNATIAQPSAS